MAKYRKKPVVVEATQWFKNGDHPEDACTMVKSDPNSVTQFEPFLSEGKIVRNFEKAATGSYLLHCNTCGREMRDHGWIDTLEGGHIVCPGDWIITGVANEHYPCKPDIFEKTYEPIQDA